MSPSIPRRLLRGLAAAALVVLVLALSVSAHSELKSSDPAAGATVPSPVSGPVVLTFSEDLADGSKADLVGPDGSTVAAAIIDASAATMTFSLTSALAPGAYAVEWVSVADDGDLRRGTLKFSVAAAAPSTAPAASGSDTSGGGGDVVLPIIIVLAIVAAGAFYLVRRNRPA